jgi:hypothetical protein
VLPFCQRIAPTRNKITKISRIVAMDVMAPPLPGPPLEYLSLANSCNHAAMGV